MSSSYHHPVIQSARPLIVPRTSGDKDDKEFWQNLHHQSASAWTSTLLRLLTSQNERALQYLYYAYLLSRHRAAVRRRYDISDSGISGYVSEKDRVLYVDKYMHGNVHAHTYSRENPSCPGCVTCH
jgi:hypothetical protein